MACEQWKGEVLDYIGRSKFAVLTYVREDLAPVSRAMGSFAPDGLDLYFSTRKDAPKVQEIDRHRNVSFFFEHDNQALETWKNVLLIGEAEQLEQGDKLDRAVLLLGNRNPRFKERVANGELQNTAIFRIRTKEIEYLDRSKGNGSVKKEYVS
ncbi:MAG: putative stress protein [Geobacteraceae bacterium]|nr:MAG: putative stress protein [Geobacteraceae bacterium]